MFSYRFIVMVMFSSFWFCCNLIEKISPPSIFELAFFFRRWLRSFMAPGKDARKMQYEINDIVPA